MLRSALLACVCLFVCAAPGNAGERRISRLVKKFNRSIKKKDWEKAEQLLEKASEQFPDSPMVVSMQIRAKLLSSQNLPEDPWGCVIATRERSKQFPFLSGTQDHPWADRLVEAEIEIFAALEQRCSFQFDDVSLRQALVEICRETGINVVLDERGLQKIEVSSETPINLKTQNVSLRSTLKLILEPLKLKYRIEDEVLKISNEFRGPRLDVRTYPVADLVTPFPGQQIVRRENGREFLTDQKELLEFETDALLDLIQSTVSVDSWGDLAGGGSISFFPQTRSLVVRQKPAVHSEISDLLEQLRRLHDIQPVIESKILTVPSSFPVFFDADGEPDESAELAFLDKSHRLMDKWASEALLAAIQQSAKGNILTAPKITLFNGQTAELQMHDFGGDGTTLGVRAVASSDRKAVRCELTLKTGDEKSEHARKLELTFQDGQSLLIDLGPTEANNARKLLLVNADVIIQSE